jgi:hypothetical protein
MCVPRRPTFAISFPSFHEREARNMARAKSGSGSRKTQSVSRNAPAKPPSIRGEKRVKETRASVPVGPARRKRGTHDAPTDPAAVDRRKQFSGTDQPADTKRGKTRRPSGGNAGRTAVGLPANT